MPVSYEGYLADGNTALRRPVRVTLTGQSLQLLDEHGDPIDTWPLAGMRLSEEVYSGQPLRFIHGDREDASLTIPSHALLDAVAAVQPRLRTGYLARSGVAGRLIRWGTATVLAVAGLVLSIPYLDTALARLVPMQWETALGETVVEAMTSKGASCTDAAGEAALQTLVNRLAKASGSPYPFKVSVIDREVVNAFAAPGSHIVVFKGLIESAESPQEVAGVLAHEMGHVVERHALQGLFRSMGLAYTVSVLTGDASIVTSGLADVGQKLLLLAHSRSDEAEADRVGVELLRRAGIGSRGLADFLARLEEDSGDAPDTAGQFLSSHPSPGARVRAIESLPPGAGPVLDPQQWQALKGICSARHGAPDPAHRLNETQ